MARPRQPELDDRILDAARTLVAERGYDDVTMEAVAAAAGVGKPTLYRRWPTKAQLFFAATVQQGLPTEIPDTGTFAGDVRIALRALVDSLAGPPRAALADQFGAMIADAGFAAEVRRLVTEPELDRIVAIWERAEARGEVDPDLDGRELLRDASSAVIWRRLLYHLPMEAREIDAMADRIWRSARR